MNVLSAPAPVIALHCSGAGAGQWRALADVLGARHPLIAPEHYGCESTGPWTGEHAFTLADEAERTIEIIDRTDANVHLVGHSYGGGVALRAAVERPDRIAGLTLDPRTRCERIDMKNPKTWSSPTPHRNLPAACAAALAAIFTVSLPAGADPVRPPPVPANLQVPAGNKAFLVGHAIGTQNYSCLPAGVDAEGHPRYAWTLFTPQATLFAHNLKEVATHFFSPNPLEVSPSPLTDGPVRATWQDAKDASTVWGKVMPGDSSADPAFVAPGAIAWLRITIVGAEEGPTRGDALTLTTYIHRLNTSGGLAPSTGCAAPPDVGSQAFVPYEADYVFYK